MSLDQFNALLINKNITFLEYVKSSFAKTKFLTIFKNPVFSLCISINLNQTAVGLFWLG